MQGDSSSSVLPNSAPDVATNSATNRAAVHEVGGHGGDGDAGEDRAIIEEGDRMSYGANRWPRQETLALLKIRSDMDAVFRDSSLKGPLWKEVSRKLAELGYHRSAKKCKEKFENLYKYHKRTKDGRTGKSEGKTYRFFDQLEAFESHHHHSQSPALPQPPQLKAQPAIMAATTTNTTTNTTLPWSSPPNVTHATVPSTTNHPSQNNTGITPTATPTPLTSSQSLNPSHQNMFPSSNLQNITSHLFSSSTSSSTASDEELQASRKRKRRWKDFFERLTKDVIRKQEELQRKFLDTVEKREHERIAHEEAWRMQEMVRINREHEILIQERTTAAAKDAAVIAFLQKISGQQNSFPTIDIPQQPSPVPVSAPAAQALALTQTPPPPPQLPATAPVPVAQSRPQPAASVPTTKLDIPKKDNGHDNNNNNSIVSSSSRWPKVEVEALIRLRTSLDTKYQENGPKGPLWEEISAGMQRLGYNRSAKRCKEKWENINKYFKKVKECNKKRSEASKTCPYFHQLDAIYKEKAKNMINDNNSATPAHHLIAVTTMEPLMVRPEQQWPPQPHTEMNGRGILMDHNIEEDEEENDDDEDDEGETEEQDEGGGGFQVVASKPPVSVGNGE